MRMGLGVLRGREQPDPGWVVTHCHPRTWLFTQDTGFSAGGSCRLLFARTTHTRVHLACVPTTPLHTPAPHPAPSLPDLHTLFCGLTVAPAI